MAFNKKHLVLLSSVFIASCAADRAPVRQGDLGVLDGDLLQKVSIKTIPDGANCSRTLRSNNGAGGWSTSIFLETTTFDIYCTHANKPQKLTLHSSVLTDDFEEYRAVSTASSFLFGGPLLGITQAATSSSNEHLFRRFPPIAHVVFAQSPATTREDTINVARENWATQRKTWAAECAGGLAPEHLLCRTALLDQMPAADLDSVGRQFDQNQATSSPPASAAGAPPTL